MWKTPSLQNGMSQLNYKLIRHRLATCKMFHAFHPCLASTKRWLVVPSSDMLIVYKMNLWFCKNMINIYSLQNACYLQNALPNITLTVQNSTLQSFCRQLKFSHSVGEIVRGIYFRNKDVCIYTCTVYTYKNRNAARCTTINFDNLNELIQFALFTFRSRQNFKDFRFSTIIEKFKTPSDFSASSPVCRSQLKKTMIL